MTVKDEAMTRELGIWLSDVEEYYNLVAYLLPKNYEEFRETVASNGLEKIGDIDLFNKELDIKELDEVIKFIKESEAEKF